MNLLLDTSYNQILALYDDEGQIRAQRKLAGQRSSSQLHQALHELFQEAGVAEGSVPVVSYVAGPGFYTGLRVGLGVADMFRLHGAQVREVYSHELPLLLGERDYCWMTKAYRGEVFLAEAVGGNITTRLVGQKEYVHSALPSRIYIHDNEALDDQLRAKVQSRPLVETQKILLERWGEIHRLLGPQEGPRPLLYFRTAEEEFRPNP